MTIGSRKTVPPRMFRIVPLGESHTGKGQGRSKCTADSWKLTFLELEFLDSLLIRGNGGALDADRVFLDRVGRVHRDLVFGLISVG